MSEKLDKIIDESIDKTFKPFSERIKEGKNRVEDMLKQAEDLENRLNIFSDYKEV